MYSDIAEKIRLCKGTCKNGKPCKAYACWDSSEQLCNVHAGRHHKGKILSTPTHMNKRKHANCKLCSCEAYNWPHRPGSGLCCWPEPPFHICLTPASTHSFDKRPNCYSKKV